MNQLSRAMATLPGHTLVLCKDETVLVDDRHGIAPMMAYLAEGRDFTGYAVADTVVGRAAAMLFLKAGIREVYARNLSEGALVYLKARGAHVRYSHLTKFIANRDKTGVCPMETAVAGTDDPEEGYRLLKTVVQDLSADRT